MGVRLCDPWGMELDGILSALFAGVVIGLLGRLLAPRSGNIGCLLTILLGIVGGAIGTWIGVQIAAGFWLTLLMQVIVAALLVSVFAALARRR
jgi:uncharacterized membrane protein YeaQ/YmgE (transglycosylase-associated protein family)